MNEKLLLSLSIHCKMDCCPCWATFHFLFLSRFPFFQWMSLLSLSTQCLFIWVTVTFHFAILFYGWKVIAVVIDPVSFNLSHFHFPLWKYFLSLSIHFFLPFESLPLFSIRVTFPSIVKYHSIYGKSLLSLSIHCPPIWVTFRSVPLPAKCVLSFENCRELKTFSIFARKPFNKFRHHPHQLKLVN